MKQPVEYKTTAYPIHAMRDGHADPSPGCRHLPIPESRYDMACYLDLGTPIRVLVADDHSAVRDALVRVIASSSGAMVAGVACDTEGAIGLAEKIQPDVALLEVRMPGGGGDRAAREIRRLSPETAVVALSAYCDRATVLRMLEGGAISYLSKSASAEEIIRAIRRAACGVSTFSPDVVTEVAPGLARQMEATKREPEREQVVIDRITGALSAGQPAVMYQPVVDLETGEAVGFEALARFSVEPEQSPNVWFAEAAAVGLLIDLELASVQAAIGQIDRLPAHAFLSVNVSPQAVNSRRLQRTLAGSSKDRIVVEVSERALVRSPEDLSWSLHWLRRAGVRVCLDDAGTDLRSLQWITRLKPDFIKLDIELTQGIDADETGQAITSLLRRSAVQTGTVVIAKGIETEAELSTLRKLGVPFGQGFYLGAPQPIDAASGEVRHRVSASPSHGELSPRSLDRARSRRIVGYRRESSPWYPRAMTGMDSG